MPYLSTTAAAVLAAVFGIACIAKVRSRRAFAAFARSPLLAIGPAALPLRVRAAAVAIVEAAVTVGLLVPAARMAAFLGAGLTLAVFTGVLRRVLRTGRRAECACFGSGGSPISTVDIYRNLALLMTAVAGAIATAADSGRAAPAGLLVAWSLGAFVGLAVTRLDDIIALYGPASFRR